MEARTWLTREESLKMSRKNLVEQDTLGTWGETVEFDSGSYGDTVREQSSTSYGPRSRRVPTSLEDGRGRREVTHRPAEGDMTPPRPARDREDRGSLYEAARTPSGFGEGRLGAPRSPEVGLRGNPRQYPADDLRGTTPPFPIVKVHPDRARLLDDQRGHELRSSERPRWPDTPQVALPILPRNPSPLPRTSKTPIRIKRRPKSPAEHSISTPDLANADNRPIVPDVSTQKPHNPRGNSLLERLSLDSPPTYAATPLPSLKDRVEQPAKQSLEEVHVHGLPPRPAPINVMVAEEAETSARGGRGGKRRNGKPRRGRR